MRTSDDVEERFCRRLGWMSVPLTADTAHGPPEIFSLPAHVTRSGIKRGRQVVGNAKVRQECLDSLSRTKPIKCILVPPSMCNEMNPTQAFEHRMG